MAMREKCLRQMASLVLGTGFLLAVSVAQAGAALDAVHEKGKVYLAAAASLAAYNDRLGMLVNEALQEEGWEITKYKHSTASADARFIVLKNLNADSWEPTYTLAVAGTENTKDIKTDMKLGKVWFTGATQAEFNAAGAATYVPDDKPKVHKGFYQYVQTAIDAGEDGHPIYKALMSDPSQRLLITGHSLGGAVATLGGARLLLAGVNPAQVEVLTFGAPAVGNAAFKQETEGKLALERVVLDGDPVPGLVQKFGGGYAQFGKEVRWQEENYMHQKPHSMAVYMDVAMKDYYRALQEAEKAGEIVTPRQSEGEGPKAYVVPASFKLPQEMEAEQPFMQQVMERQYRRALKGYVLADAAAATPKGDLEAAKQAGCQWLVRTEVQVTRLRQEVNGHVISLNQTVYRVADGRLAATSDYQSSTRELTPLVVIMHLTRNFAKDGVRWLDMPQKG